MHVPTAQPIRTQLMLLLLVLGLPFLLYLGISGVVHARRERAQAGSQMLALAHVTAARLDDHVGDITEVLAVLSESVGVTPADEDSNDALLTRLEPRLPPQINNVTVFTADGRIVGSLDPRMRSRVVDMGIRAFLGKALAQPDVVVQAPFKSAFNGENVGVFAQRIVRGGRVVGVVSMGTRLRELQALLAPAGSLPAGAVTTVVSHDGVVLARSIDPDRWIGRDLSALSSDFAECLRLRDGVKQGPSSDGIRRIAGVTIARRVPWLVYVGLPESDALSESRDLLLENLAAGAVMLLLGVLLSVGIARRIALPLRRLQADARLLEAGDLAHRSTVRGHGEIPVLAHTLNQMAEALQQRTRLLESSQRQLADLYENAPCGYHSLDASGRFVRINDTELGWLGLAREDVVGRRHITDFMIPEGRERFAREFGRLQTEGHLDNLEFELVGESGARRHVLASVSVLRDANGAFEMTRTVLVDISERRNAEQARLLGLALELENRRLVEASKFKDVFLSNMSHELRTPLNAVVGYTHLLRTGLVKPNAPEFAQHLERIGQGAHQLQEMIAAMLDFAKADAELIELDPRPVDLSRSVQAVLDGLGDAIRDKRIDFAAALDPALVPNVDELRLTQVLSALVSNAVKFSRDGGLVEIRASADGPAKFRIEVEDHGLGIPAADLPRLFTVFHRLDEGGTRAHAGAGIGLALARRVVEAQGGSLDVDSRLAFGSTFRLVLPMMRG